VLFIAELMGFVYLKPLLLKEVFPKSTVYERS